jgi:acyl-CoA synthetase (NDP forming)
MVELASLLAAYGIPAVGAEVAASAEAAAAVAERIGFPVALKIVSPEITHKTEVGGVVLGLGDARAVREAAAVVLRRVAVERPQAVIQGLLVQAMAPVGKELLLGGVRDAQFGPLVMVGLGGIYVEVLADTAARLAPVSPGEALGMLDELKAAPLLRGVRGERGVDREALAAIVARFSELLVDLPEVTEIEINPLTVGPTGAVAVDARARLGP